MQTVYRGSVKDVLGPLTVAFDSAGPKGGPAASVRSPAYLFRFSDAYSVFDWGKMPDPIDGKGAALAVLAAELFGQLEKPESWKEFSRSGEAFELRAGVAKIAASTEGKAPGLMNAPRTSLGSTFNEIGESLQSQGLRTHYLGLPTNKGVSEHSGNEPLQTHQPAALEEPVRHLAVRPVSVVPPELQKILGRTVRDYEPTRTSPAPRLVPLEVVFRFTCPPGSSLLSRAKANPEYVAGLAIPQEEENLKSGKRPPGEAVQAGDRWRFPVLELFTKLEPSDRAVTFTEALSMTGLSAPQLEALMLRTAWVAGYLRYRFRTVGLELADGKLEWGVDEKGGLMLVDAIGPDELRLLRKGVQLSKEFLRRFYKGTAWSEALSEAKRQAALKGTADFKRFVTDQPPALAPEYLEAASQMYWALTNAIAGGKWFPNAWSIDQVADKIAALESARAGESRAAAPGPAGKTVLVVGGGGREHALAWKLAQSPRVSRLILAPGNDGIRARGTGKLKVERWEFDAARGKDEFEALASKAKAEGVDLVVVGPDNPLADGIVDILEAQGILAFGPRAEAARLEASKSFAKDLMKSAGVPTAHYVSVTTLEEANRFLRSVPWDAGGWVVKADGLALGKGVVVCRDLQQATEAAERLITVSGRLVIEEFLSGVEISWMAFCDGKRCSLLEPARDYKRLLDGNDGPNTGGMGAYSPVREALDPELESRVRAEVFLPVLREMSSLGTPFQGLLYAGLMMDPETRKFSVLEFNARFGDPETQVLVPRIRGDLYDWCEACAKGDLGALPDRVPFEQDFAVYVVGAAAGYPEKPEKGVPIEGPITDYGIEDPEVGYFCAGVKSAHGGPGLVTSGGRVFGALGRGRDLRAAAENAYGAIRRVKFSGMQFRTDITR